MSVQVVSNILRTNRIQTMEPGHRVLGAVPFPAVAASRGRLLNLCLVERFHVHVLPGPPLVGEDVTETGRYQHQGGLSVREAAHHVGPASDLPVQTLQGVVGPDLPPVATRKGVGAQGFLGYPVPGSERQRKSPRNAATGFLGRTLRGTSRNPSC